MTIGLVILLAVVQGLTEFLPVSSSGHLRLLQLVFGVDEAQTLFDIILHVGTLIPVMIVYRVQLIRMVSDAWMVARRRATVSQASGLKLAMLIVCGSVPTACIGIGLGGLMESLTLDLGVICGALVVNALVLFYLGYLQARPEQPGRTLEELTLKDALIIGTIQGLAVFRGISRSGSTITAAMVCGLNRQAAATFSFLLSIPAISGALLLEFDLEAFQSQHVGLYLLGGAVACISGTAALLGLLRLLEGGRLHLFGWYCLFIAALGMFWRFGSIA